MLYISDYGPIVTKKNMATPFVSNLLSLIESQSTIHGTIARLARDIESFSTPHQGELQNLVDQQQELKETSDRLAKKIQRGMSTLQQKSQATAAVLKQAQQDQFLNILLQAKAVKQRLCQKLVSHQLASERISRSIRGTAIGISSFCFEL